MARTASLPAAECKVQMRVRPDTQHRWGAWRDSMDLDPMTVPVEAQDPATGLPVSTDVFHPGVIGLVGTICDMDSAANVTEYRLVWSLTGFPVRGTCPVCDDDFEVSEGAPGDEVNEGYDAVFCGCDPRSIS